MSAGPAIRRLAQVSIPTHDVGRATAFYRDRLGLVFLFSAGTMAFFDLSGVRLVLALPEQAEHDHPGSILYLDVADIAASYRALVASGVEFEGEPHLIARLATSDLWMAFFRDSEGNTLALSSEVPRPA